jgi:hypothetical protein
MSQNLDLSLRFNKRLSEFLECKSLQTRKLSAIPGRRWDIDARHRRGFGPPGVSMGCGIVLAEPRSFAESKIRRNGLERDGRGRFEFQFRAVRVNTS